MLPFTRAALLLLVAACLLVCQRLEAETVSTDRKEVSSEIITRRYSCPADYSALLYQKAFEKTGDVAFQRPVKTTVVWDPWPSKALRKLGLPIRDGYSMAYKPMENVFVYSADRRGHEEFLKLNELLSLKVRSVP